MENETAKQINADEPQIFDVAEAMKRRDHISGRVDMARSPNSFVAVFLSMRTESVGGRRVAYVKNVSSAVNLKIPADYISAKGIGRHRHRQAAGTVGSVVQDRQPFGIRLPSDPGGRQDEGASGLKPVDQAPSACVIY
jgi:hypothetical protein